ncbi:hypothetical protein DPMN_084301 [Dreissena polymorpha]|uniref:Uncharacterized protein n=1 Tax=Dreissena polymorpha TaxID=45954 RepID=A0A9D3YAA9_DREPO|nr:hypothetical protein DPMN_084301 [Dreissena polymorpha]
MTEVGGTAGISGINQQQPQQQQQQHIRGSVSQGKQGPAVLQYSQSTPVQPNPWTCLTPVNYNCSLHYNQFWQTPAKAQMSQLNKANSYYTNNYQNNVDFDFSQKLLSKLEMFEKKLGQLDQITIKLSRITDRLTGIQKKCEEIEKS